MKAIILTLCAAVMAAHANICAGGTIETDSTDITNRVRYYLEFQKTTFTNGEKIIASVVLTNFTDQKVVILPTYIGLNTTLTVTNEAQMQLAPVIGAMRYKGSISGSLYLEAHHDSRGQLNISHYYDLKPGTYHIYSTRNMASSPPWVPITIAAPSVVIKVTESNSARR